MKKNKKSILDDKRVTLVTALVLAALAWIIIAGFLNPGQSRTLRSLPINYEQNQADYQGKNLQMVSRSELMADVRVTGDSSVIGTLGNTSVTVYVDYSVVTGPGTFSCPLRVTRNTTETFGTNVSIRNAEHSLDNNPWDQVTLTFEEVERRSFPVAVKAEGVSAAGGFYRDTPVVQPAEIRVTGPQNEVDRIAQVVAVIEEDEEISDTKRYSDIRVALLDGSGNTLDAADMGVTLSAEHVEVDVPVYEIRTIGLAVEFIGFGRNFDTDWLYDRVELSATELQVVGPSAVFDHLDDPLTIATFDVSELSMGWESPLINVELPEGLHHYDQLRQVMVSLDTTGMEEKTFEVPAENVRVQNGPRNAAVTPMMDTISVMLVGDAEQLSGILPENISVQLDATSVSASKGGQQNVPARIQVPGAGRVFAVGSYSIVCEVAVEQ